MGRKDLKTIVLNFAPSWSAVTMGTGVLSLILYDAPHQFLAETYIAIAVYAFNIVLFLTFLGRSIARILCFPWVVKRIRIHTASLVYLGTYPVGLATIINATVIMLAPVAGPWIISFISALWWCDVVLSCLSAILLPLILFEYHELALKDLTAAWLLPIVPLVVASGSGGAVSTILSPMHAQWTLALSLMLWSMGMELSLLIIGLYIQRHIIHNLPSREVIISSFLPLGPIAQGSYAIVQIGRTAQTVLAEKDIAKRELLGDIFVTCCTVSGIVLWGFAIWWFLHTVLSIDLPDFTGRMSFNMRFWGCTFPIGVLTTAIINLSINSPRPSYKR
ncbi:hypothetical protein BZG36_05453 [Bifiguratus adelaidae]|uniref:Sulfite efflux pump SSU1 n=1 Tax=Bifiguratus adelaidae TaxID=1938954 RepID=A0A261XTV6_9FUNG|nr:hypothetical protein BZG36_05453 [Bifiguratus adelaidae]